jgi:hypothetical protein
MQLDSAAALRMFRDALAPCSPNATLTGQTLSSGSLPTCPLPAPTHPAAAAQRKAGLRPAAGTAAMPGARHRQQAGAVRHPRAPATSARVGYFDAARRNPYAQSMRLLAHDNAASPPPRHAAEPLATRCAIPDGPTVGNQTIGLPAHLQPPPRSAISTLPATTRTPRGRARWHSTAPPRCRPALRSNRVNRRKARGLARYRPATWVTV